MISPEAYDSFEPPLGQTISEFQKSSSPESGKNHRKSPGKTLVIEEQDCPDLPLINISRLSLEEGSQERKECEREIVEAASQWGFFQIVNHGIPEEVVDQMKREERRAFQQPFGLKSTGGGKLCNLGPRSYRWGNPSATCLRQMSWSEAFHIAITDISSIEDETLRSAIEMFEITVASLVEKIAEILATNLGDGGTYFRERCTRKSSYLRLNRYPPCPYSSEVYGLVPHTDSDFLTIVCQDGVGGLQMMKDDGSWAGVSPNPNVLVINIGDLLEAWSNGVYKSVRHRVMASPKEERLSVAFFYCPTSDTVIRSCTNPAIYRNFSFLQYLLQVQEDVQATGDKVGLSRFLAL